MIELNNITHNYKDKCVFDDFSLNIESGKLTCLLGDSGSGKTTILRVIAGLEIPTKGNVIIDNKTLTSDSNIEIEANKRNIGFIFQDLALWPHFTVYKNIAFGLKEQNAENIKQTVNDILTQFGIEEHINKYPHQLSGGQKQLVAIARSLVLKPQILLMDEPLSNLDVKLKRKLLEHIKIIKQQYDLTIIYVTHDHREAFEIADNIVVLNNGEIEDSGSVEQIKSSNNEYVKYFLEY